MSNKELKNLVEKMLSVLGETEQKKEEMISDLEVVAKKTKKPRKKRVRTAAQVKADKERMAKLRQMRKKKK